ncbi:PREDICTED: CGG triplet repeat-binding protein 1-like, partial [Rhagoletis zephyria]|uniref:CGG triplet repeat-binding protein 1-like n=1 Tax=Rhagoletis zephyria TaxID=28612 RepID=UPI0008118F22
MPKHKPSYQQLVRVFGEDTFSCDASMVFCKACSKGFPGARKFTLEQHVKTSLHKESLQRHSSRQQLLSDARGDRPKNDFSMELCTALVKADIPLHKVSHPAFKEFLEKHTSFKVQDESTLRRSCLPLIYDSSLRQLQQEIGDSDIWVGTDETTDSKGRCIVNVTV